MQARTRYVRPAIFSFTRPRDLRILLPAILSTACSSALTPATAVFMGKFGDAVAQFGGGLIDSNTLRERTSSTINGFVAIGCLGLILNGLMYATWMVFGELQAKRVREDLFRSLLEKDLDWFEARESGVASLLTRLQTQIRELQLGASQPLAFTIHGLCEGMVSFGLAMFYSWKLTLVVLSGLPIAGVLFQLTSTRIQRHIQLQHECLAKASTTSNFSIANISFIKISNTQTQELFKYTASIRSAAVYALRQARLSALQFAVLVFSLTTLFMLGFWYGGKLVHDDQTTAGKVLTATWTAFMSLNAFQSISAHLIPLEKGHAAAVALHNLIDTVDRGQKFKRTAGFSPKLCEGQIELHQVSFHYPGRRDHLVLNNTSAVFQAGRLTFLIGKSGSGKSTIGNLLTRFYAASMGCITIDGHDIRDISLDWLRNNITLVQQDTSLFNETLFTNIALGHRRHEHVKSSQVWECARLALLESTISELPYGIDTRVGVGGKALSGGQSQRVALARARLRNAPILILDESTSALDKPTRVAVIERIRAWRAGMTTVIITHDMSQIEKGDTVHVLDQGKITPESLETGHRRKTCSFEDAAILSSDPKVTGNRRNRIRPTSLRWVKPSKEQRASFEKQVDELVDGAYLKSPRMARTTARMTPFAGNGPFPRKASLHLSRMQPRIPDVLSATNVPVTALPNSEAELNSSRLRDLPARSGGTIRTSYLSNIETRLPSPRLLEHSGRGIRAKFGGPSFHKIEEGDPPQLSLQEVFVTVWPALSRSNRMHLVIGLLAFCSKAALPSVLSYSVSKVFETYYMADDYESKALKWFMVLLTVAITDSCLTYTGSYLLDIAARRWVDCLRCTAMQRVLQQPKVWFEDDCNSTSYLSSVLDRNVEEMRSLVSRHAASLLNVVIMLCVAVIWSTVLCWQLTLIGIGALPLIIGLVKGLDMTASKWEARTNSSTDAIGAVFTEIFMDVRTVRSLTLEGYFHRKYAKATSAAFVIGRRRTSYMAALYGLSESTIHFLMAVLMWYAVRLATSFETDATALFTSMSLMFLTCTQAGIALMLIPSMAMATESATRVIRLTRLKVDSGPKHTDVQATATFALSAHQTTNKPTAAITISNLSFSYSTRPGAPIVQSLSLHIPSNTITAVVGPSGSGKSTIAALLLNLYPVSPPSSITLLDRPLHAYSSRELASLVTLVPQSRVLLPSASIRENLTYGLDPHTHLTVQPNIELAARRAGIHDFITSLPKGYDTIIGGNKPDTDDQQDHNAKETQATSQGVSGGQLKRLAIARALVRRPRVLILDEALGGLDGETKKVVCDGLREAMGAKGEGDATGDRDRCGMGRGKGKGRDLEEEKGERTIVMITHDVDTMKFADWIVVLGEKGRAVDEGKWRDLMGEEGGALKVMLRDEGADKE